MPFGSILLHAVCSSFRVYEPLFVVSVRVVMWLVFFASKDRIYLFCCAEFDLSVLEYMNLCLLLVSVW